jgi:hypothetical protein
VTVRAQPAGVPVLRRTAKGALRRARDTRAVRLPVPVRGHFAGGGVDTNSISMSFQAE